METVLTDSSFSRELTPAGSVKHSENKGPLLVHCSAGLGRTGVLIALRSVIQQLDRENAVDIFATVLKLRKQRAGMVEVICVSTLLYGGHHKPW